MKILIKDFNVDMEIKNNGIELEIRNPDGSQQLGDLYVTRANLIWCSGKIKKENGVKIPWNDFIEWAESD